MGRFWVCLLPAVILALGLVLASRAVIYRQAVEKSTDAVELQEANISSQ